MALKQVAYKYYTPPEMEVNFLNDHVKGFNKIRLNNVFDVIYQKSDHSSVIIDSISGKIADHNLPNFKTKSSEKQFEDCFFTISSKNLRVKLVLMDNSWYRLKENYLGSLNQIEFIPYKPPFTDEMISSWKRMVSMILHRLRSPLTGVSGYLELLPTNIDDEAALKKINAVELGINKIIDLLEEIEELVKIDNNIKINEEVTDLEAATYSMLSTFNEFEDSNIILNSRKNYAIRTYQKNELNLIIKILLENCLIHGDISKNIHVEIHNNWLQITNKIDKDLEIKDDLFQPFVSSKADRMGLGLTLATILCQSINGILHYNTNTLKDEFSIMLCLP